MESDVLEPESNAASKKGNPDEVTLKDVLKPSILLIALAASVLLISFCWYLFVLKPALIEGNPLDIRLTKEPLSDTPPSQELKSKPEVETQLTSNDVEPSNEALLDIKAPEEVQRINPPRRIKPTLRNTPIKSAKSNVARVEKVPMAQTQDSPYHQNNHEEDKKNEVVMAENITPLEDSEKDEDMSQKIKSFAVKWKESILIPATQSTCTQVQISMNQCPN